MEKKKIYQPPYVEVFKMESESVFAASQSTTEDFWYNELEELGL